MSRNTQHGRISRIIRRWNAAKLWVKAYPRELPWQGLEVAVVNDATQL